MSSHDRSTVNGSRTIGFFTETSAYLGRAIANERASCIAASVRTAPSPRGAAGKESLAAVDTTVFSLRCACPGTPVAASSAGAWIEDDEVQPAIASLSGMSCRVTPVNLSECDAPAIISTWQAVAGSTMIEAEQARVADAEVLVSSLVARPVLRH